MAKVMTGDRVAWSGVRHLVMARIKGDRLRIRAIETIGTIKLGQDRVVPASVVVPFIEPKVVHKRDVKHEQAGNLLGHRHNPTEEKT